MEYLECDPMKIHPINNYSLVEFIDDDITKPSQVIKIVKQNNSSKLRSDYLGKILYHPQYIYDENHNIVDELSQLVDGETLISYNPMSIKIEITWNSKKYHLIRSEDIYCIVKED